MKDVNEKTSFTRYCEGYEDGYGVRRILMPDDEAYMNGYSAGKEDDQYGMPSKYSETLNEEG